MRFVCDSCRAQYMISDEKVGPKGVKVRCKKCGYVILVKKADANGHATKSAHAPAAPVPLSNDPDDALATQVMQNPLSGGGMPSSATLPINDDSMTNPGLGEEKTTQMPAAGAGLLDASEDEIGAVFDQVLNSGAHSIPKGARQPERPAMGDEPDDRMSTRVLDSETVKKLAEESGDGKNGHGPAREVPKTDWFVAIDDKQTGPLTLEKIKEHWERGEIGPDSLCWRAGFSDWIPVSEVSDLAAELAPRPTKPVMVAPVTVGGGMPGSVVSVPVESAFSAGGMMKSVRSEVQVPLAAAAPEETGSWRPSAASALASLVKEEMEALAKPPTNGGPEPVGVGDSPLASSGGLLNDLPEASVVQKKGMNGHSNPRADAVQPPGEMTSAHGPRNPYIASPGATYSSPGVTQYRPPSDTNKTAIIAIIALSVVAVLGIGAFVLVSLNKPQVATVAQPVAMQPVPPAPGGQVAPPAQPPVAVQPNPGQPQPPAAAQPPPGAQPAPGTQPPPPNPNTQAANGATGQGTGGTATKPHTEKSTVTKPPSSSGEKLVASAKEPKEPKEPVEKPPKEEKPEKSKPVVEAKGGDDEFAAAFGTGKPDKPEKKERASSSDKSSDEGSSPKKSSVYIPPAPGQGGNIPETLGQADIMEVVKSNIGPIKNCVDQQKAKEPGTSGKLVMKWTIQTSGKTTKVEVVSEEFKSTFLAGCVGGLIKTWQFPKHKTQGEPVVFPFKF
jgi:predicted Zn finger-like uncharacterized protein